MIQRYPWWLQCVLLWLSAFLLLNIVGLVGAQFLDLDQAMYSNHDQLPALYRFPGIWRRWDAGYYLGIAVDGYAKHPGAAGFFPLYPALVGLFYRITRLNPAFLGVFVSNTSFLCSILLFYKIARLVKDDHTFAIQSVLAMLVFPTSFFYFAIYAESLYLLLALSGVYLLLRSRQSFVGSGLALGLASLARPVGWLVDVVMLFEFIRRRKFDIKSFLSLGIGLFFSVFGVLLYIYYLYVVFGTFTAIPEAQSHWPRQWQFPWITYWEGLKTLATPSLIREDWFLYAMNTLDLLFTGFAFFVIIISFSLAKRKEFPWSLSLYSTIALLFFLSSQNELPVPLWGMSRWVASLFPLYFILGNMFKDKKMQILYYLGSASLLLFFTAWWTSGRWIG
jgi:Gpi18-like mannosyltransferase